MARDVYRSDEGGEMSMVMMAVCGGDRRCGQKVAGDGYRRRERVERLRCGEGVPKTLSVK